MTDIAAGIISAYMAIAIFIQWPQVLDKLIIADIEFAPMGKSAPMPAVACRHRTIKHVHPKPPVSNNLVRKSNAHKISRLFRRQIRNSPVERLKLLFDLL